MKACDICEVTEAGYQRLHETAVSFSELRLHGVGSQWLCPACWERLRRWLIHERNKHAPAASR